jgi:hypothetical protein
VTIDESGANDPARNVDFAVGCNRVKDMRCRPDRDNPAISNRNCAVGNESRIAQASAALRPVGAGACDKLARIA